MIIEAILTAPLRLERKSQFELNKAPRSILQGENHRWLANCPNSHLVQKHPQCGCEIRDHHFPPRVWASIRPQVALPLVSKTRLMYSPLGG